MHQWNAHETNEMDLHINVINNNIIFVKVHENHCYDHDLGTCTEQSSQKHLKLLVISRDFWLQINFVLLSKNFLFLRQKPCKCKNIISTNEATSWTAFNRDRWKVFKSLIEFLFFLFRLRLIFNQFGHWFECRTVENVCQEHAVGEANNVPVIHNRVAIFFNNGPDKGDQRDDNCRSDTQEQEGCCFNSHRE